MLYFSFKYKNFHYFLARNNNIKILMKNKNCPLTFLRPTPPPPPSLENYSCGPSGPHIKMADLPSSKNCLLESNTKTGKVKEWWWFEWWVVYYLYYSLFCNIYISYIYLVA